MNNPLCGKTPLAGLVGLMLTTLVGGCGGDDGGTTGPDQPTTGTISVSVTTTGEDPDSDGYSVLLDGTEKAAVGANGTVNLSEVEPGSRSVSLSAVATNCGVLGDHPRAVSVTAGSTATATFEVDCSAMVGSIDVTVVTTGQGLDPDGYLVHLDGDGGTEITANGSLSFPDLAVGNHTVELSEVADNCTVVSSNPQTVSVPLSDAAQATFEVECISISFSSVHALAGFSCGLEEGTGKAYCWGANADGELGTGATGLALATPHPVQTEATFGGLPGGWSGEFFMCGIAQAGAVAGAGAVWCWGNGFDLTPAPIDLPAGVNGMGAVSAFGGPGLSGLSLTGQLYLWALDEGILGEAGPAPPDGSPEWAHVSSWAYHTCGVTSAGNAYCWGGTASICGSDSWNCNRFGQFGNGTTDDSLTPVKVADPAEGPVTWQAVEVGNEFSCGMTDAGRVYCWGSNYMGMLGSGDETEDFYYSTVPVEATGGRTFTAFSVGLEHVCAIEAGGTVYCWGSNKDGQLGVAETGYAGCSRGNPTLTPCGNVPLAVETSLLFTSIDAGSGSGGGGDSGWGSGHNCGLATDGLAYCWGANHSGELGDGSFTGSSSPVRISRQANP